MFASYSTECAMFCFEIGVRVSLTSGSDRGDLASSLIDWQEAIRIVIKSMVIFLIFLIQLFIGII